MSQELNNQNLEEQKANEVQASRVEKVLFAWISKEESFEKSKTWQIFMIVLVLVIASLGFYFASWSFSLLVIVFAFVYYITHKSAPSELNIKLTNIGIQISNTFYPYTSFESFTIYYIPEKKKKLILRMKNNIIAERTLDLAELDVFLIQEFLKTKIEEKPYKENFLYDAIIKIFKI